MNKLSVNQHWDPLKICIVGRSYSPEFYRFIENDNIRKVFERIARETEEDYQKLVDVLESFGIEVLRPTVTDNYTDYLGSDGKISPPPMTPCDHAIMVGDTFYSGIPTRINVFNDIRAEHWPEKITTFEEFDALPDIYKDEVMSEVASSKQVSGEYAYKDIISRIRSTNKYVQVSASVNRAMIARVGKDLIVGTTGDPINDDETVKWLTQEFTEYRVSSANTQGHGDGVYCPVKPGLIVSLYDIQKYEETFPGWEVVYLPDQSGLKIMPFTKSKILHKGKWWVPGEELNDDFASFVNGWMDHWVGYVEETVFDVNMLVIDKQNVVCNNYNKDVFDAFERHGITPHIVNFRHRYFWDSGLHCITNDLSRDGEREDYFPERGQK